MLPASMWPGQFRDPPWSALYRQAERAEHGADYGGIYATPYGAEGDDDATSA